MWPKSRLFSAHDSENCAPTSIPKLSSRPSVVLPPSVPQGATTETGSPGKGGGGGSISQFFPKFLAPWFWNAIEDPLAFFIRQQSHAPSKNHHLYSVTDMQDQPNQKSQNPPNHHAVEQNFVAARQYGNQRNQERKKHNTTILRAGTSRTVEPFALFAWSHVGQAQDD
jgi:hypothetical protein